MKNKFPNLLNDTLESGSSLQILTNFCSVLVKVPANFLVEAFVTLVDRAHIRLFKVHAFPFLLGLLFNSSFHFTCQMPGTISLLGFVCDSSIK